MQFWHSLPRIALLGTAVTLVAASTSANSIASASDPLRTRTILDGVTPITYDDHQVTVHGAVKTSPVDGSAAVGLAGEPVDIQETNFNHAAIKDLGVVTTETDGTFSLTTTVDNPGGVEAIFSGDSSNGPSRGYAAVTPATHLPARLTLDPVPSSVVAESTTKLSGLLELQAPDGTWAPAVAAYVRAVYTTSEGVERYVTYPTTGSDGRFSVTYLGFSALRESGTWHITRSADTDSFAGAAQAETSQITVTPTATQVTALSLTKPPTTGDGASFTGQVDYSADGAWTPFNWYTVTQVGLYFRPTGSANWSRVAISNTNGYGVTTFANVSAFDANGKLREGSWQARVEPSTIYQTSASATQNVVIHAKAWFSGLHVSKSGPHMKSRTFVGVLLTASPKASGQPLSGQKVAIYYRASGGKTWRLVKTVTTTTSGGLAYGLTGKAHGWYRAQFGSTAVYVGATSAGVYYSG